ncbi:MAG: 3-hydroxyacyl-CoA dehydrogenase family protein [Candidatus Promineifilaceae bacterium]|nr:3-hydroxyacyl-CoA dehydrogenase family protein [Candidatus Promineifilaceae bacterium]
MKLLLIGPTQWRRFLADRAESAGHAIVGSETAESVEEVADRAAIADTIIEYVNGDSAQRCEVLNTLGHQASSEALLLTSALTCSVSRTAAFWVQPKQVVGYGMLPLLAEPQPRFVELAAGLESSEEYLSRAGEFWQSLAFDAVFVEDSPGLIRSRILCCLVNEAAFALMADVATPEDIDQAMRLGTNYPVGPLKWADLMGVDFVLQVMTALFEEWGEERYRPAPLLRRMVTAGWMGKDAGRGFYVYE